MMAHHRRTGTGRYNHRPGPGKQIKLLSGHGAGFIRIAAVIGRLAAACLLLGKVDLYAFALQQIDCVESSFRCKLIHKASGK
jgi:hypothetical protein